MSNYSDEHSTASAVAVVYESDLRFVVCGIRCLSVENILIVRQVYCDVEDFELKAVVKDYRTVNRY